MKDIIIGISLLWLIPSSFLILNIVFYNLKIGTLKEPMKGRKYDKKGF